MGPSARGGINSCVLKARPASQRPPRGNGDGIWRLMRHHTGPRAPSEASGGDRGAGVDNSWNGGH